MPNEIDELMSLDPLNMTKDDIDGIIAYQRKQRANFEAGVKAPKKPKADGPKRSLESVLQALSAPKPTGETIKRRL